MTGYGLEAAIDSDYAGLPIVVRRRRGREWKSWDWAECRCWERRDWD